jgi:NADP-dependent 3-hydroxy acid dehydrogenase YdfG
MTYDLQRWRGRIALVTGASSGIGRAIAEDLGALGLKVAITGRRAEALAETAAAVTAAGGEARVLAGDQRDIDVNQRFFADIRAHWGPVDLLVNNAGTQGGRSLLRDSLDEIQEALDLNLRAAIVCMREAVAAMRGKSEAAIINVSSLTGHRMMPGMPAVYSATKHALRILTDGLRAEVIEERLPIKVSLLSPGMVDTPWHSRPGGVVDQKGDYLFPPLAPADLAAAVRYILSAPAGVQVSDILLRPALQAY